MKKNWMAMVSLGVSAVLLVVVLWQNAALGSMRRTLQEETANLRRELQDLSDDLLEVEGRLSEEENAFSDISLTPTQVETSFRTLYLDIAVTLKEWEDTQVELLAEIGTEEETCSMQQDGNGRYACQLALSLEEPTALRLTALIVTDGKVKQEEIGSWNSIYELLPLGLGAYSIGNADYRDSFFSGDLRVTIHKKEETQEILRPTFRIYQNGVLGQTYPAVPLAGTSDIGDDLSAAYGLDDWRIRCEKGDTIEIHFCCEDAFGVGYDFTILSWEAADALPKLTADTAVGYGSDTLSLYWP